MIFLYKLSPLIKYEISISMKYFKQTKRSEDIKLRYIVVLGGGWDNASILCIWLKWNLN
jgi:hypothetical protein